MNMFISISSVQYLLLAVLDEEVWQGALQPPGSSSHFFISCFFLGQKSSNEIRIFMICLFTHPSVTMLLLSLLRFNLADINQILPGARGFLLSSSKFLENCWQRGAAMLHPRNGKALGTQVLPALRDLSEGEAVTSGRDRIYHRVGCREVGGWRGETGHKCAGTWSFQFFCSWNKLF